MKRTVIFMVSGAVFVILLAFILLFPGTPAVQPEVSAPNSVPTPTPTGKSEISLPNISYTLQEEEEPPIQSQPPVESKPKPWAIVKAASELPLLTPEPTKTVTLPDKTVTATYVGKISQEWTNTTPLYAYVADNGDVLRFDAVGGELVYYKHDRFFGPFPMQEEESTGKKKKLSIDEAQAVAQTFARAHIDLSHYQPPTQATWGAEDFHFQYVRYIGDMPTQETVDIYISMYGELIIYEANPHLFDCIQIGAVDKSAIRQRFEEELLAEGYWLDYILQTEAISLNDLGEPCVKYEYYYELKNGSKLLVRCKEYPLIE